jgi:hypothetical protein
MEIDLTGSNSYGLDTNYLQLKSPELIVSIQGFFIKVTARIFSRAMNILNLETAYEC